jgi:transcriptional regulator with XRE-family HTH domain
VTDIMATDVLASIAADPGRAVSDEVAGMRKDLGRQLAALRRTARLTQFGLALLIGFSRSAVSLAEIGRQGQAREFWEACDKALATEGVLAAGADHIAAVHDALERAAALAAQEAREARAVAAMAAAGQPRLSAGVAAVQPCPHCGGEVTVLATLIPGESDRPTRSGDHAGL